MKNNKKIIFVLIALILIVSTGVLFTQMQDDEGKGAQLDTHTDETIVNEDSERESEDDTTDKEENESGGEEATYEERLAANTLTAISLAYPDFELQQILTETETQLNEARDSKGVYVEFDSGGETLVIHAKWLEKERTKKGTVDLHEEKLGFATFDVVSDEVLNEKNMKTLEANDLTELISEAMLVSLYEHY